MAVFPKNSDVTNHFTVSLKQNTLNISKRGYISEDLVRRMKKKRVFCFVLFSYATLCKMHKWIPTRQFNSLQCSVNAFLPVCSWPSALWLHPFSQLYSWNWWFPIFVPGEEFSNSTRLSEVQDPAATDYRFDLLHLIRLVVYWLWFVECSKNVVDRVWPTLCLTGWMDW